MTRWNDFHLHLGYNYLPCKPMKLIFDVRFAFYTWSVHHTQRLDVRASNFPHTYKSNSLHDPCKKKSKAIKVTLCTSWIVTKVDQHECLYMIAVTEIKRNLFKRNFSHVHVCDTHDGLPLSITRQHCVKCSNVELNRSEIFLFYTLPLHLDLCIINETRDCGS